MLSSSSILNICFWGFHGFRNQQWLECPLNTRETLRANADHWKIELWKETFTFEFAWKCFTFTLSFVLFSFYFWRHIYENKSFHISYVCKPRVSNSVLGFLGTLRLPLNFLRTPDISMYVCPILYHEHGNNQTSLSIEKYMRFCRHLFEHTKCVQNTEHRHSRCAVCANKATSRLLWMPVMMTFGNNNKENISRIECWKRKGAYCC